LKIGCEFYGGPPLRACIDRFCLHSNPGPLPDFFFSSRPSLSQFPFSISRKSSPLFCGSAVLTPQMRVFHWTADGPDPRPTVFPSFRSMFFRSLTRGPPRLSPFFFTLSSGLVLFDSPFGGYGDPAPLFLNRTLSLIVGIASSELPTSGGFFAFFWFPSE